MEHSLGILSVIVGVMILAWAFVRWATTMEPRLRSLAKGTFEDSLVPAEVSGATYVKDVACGAEHTCAVEADGTVACWGRGDAGQLGSSWLLALFLGVQPAALQLAPAVEVGTVKP